MQAGPAAKLALSSIVAHKLRSILTMLGVIIGVLSVVTMVSIGQGAQDEIDEQVRALGTNILILSTGFNRGGAVRAAGSGSPITDDDAEAIQDQVSGVAAVAPVRQGNAQLIAGGVNWSSQIQGSTADLLVARDWTIASGRAMTESEGRGSGKVALLGATVAKELFGNRSALGQAVRVNRVPLTVIGVLGSKGQSAVGQDQDDVVIVPLKTAQSRLLGGDRAPGEVNQVVVKAVSAAALPRVQRDVDALMRERQRLSADEVPSYNLRNLSELMAVRTETTRVMTTLLSAIASVALIVGGIGIMNIMLVSVTERTREIGLRMAVGARPADVLLQFLTEAAMLSILGGLIGVALALPLCFAIAQFAGWAVSLRVDMVVVSLVFSGLVGLVFGWYPAQRASRLNPIEALRYD